MGVAHVDLDPFGASMMLETGGEKLGGGKEELA